MPQSVTLQMLLYVKDLSSSCVTINEQHKQLADDVWVRLCLCIFPYINL